MAGTRRNLLNVVLDAGADVGVLGGITALNADNTETRLVKGAIRRTAHELCGQGMLLREQRLLTAANQGAYALPTDFMLPWTRTTWNTTDEEMIFNTSQREWQALKSNSVSSINQRYRFIPSSGGVADKFTLQRLEIDPVPTSAERVSFWYRSNHWVQTETTATITGITLSGTDAVSITATSHGLAVADVVEVFGVMGTAELNNKVYTVGSVPDVNTVTLFGSDSSEFTAYTSGGTLTLLQDTNGIGDGTTTYPLFDPDLLEMGVAYRLRQRLGFSYFDHKNEYEELLAKHLGNRHGDQVVNMGKSSAVSLGIPDGNFTQPS